MSEKEEPPSRDPAMRNAMAAFTRDLPPAERLDPMREAYAEGWRAACSVAIEWLRCLSDSSFSLPEAAGEIEAMFEAGPPHFEGQP